MPGARSNPEHAAGQAHGIDWLPAAEIAPIPQLAKILDLPLYWFYDRIRKGFIQIEKNEELGLYLFPDHPDTLEQFQLFKSGVYKKLRF